MNLSHIATINLNLLTVAAALYKHRNVSKAAEELALSQSALSHALARLRVQFNDPFFVRTTSGMVPTEYARQVQEEILTLVQRAQLLATRQRSFDPANSTARITIASTDYFEIIAMPRIQAILSAEAPLMQVSIRPTRGELPRRELEEGQVDFAIAGFYRDLPGGFYQTRLFADGFECAVGEKSSLYRKNALSTEAYFASRHALITLQGDLRENKKYRGLERKIVYGTYSFTSLAWVLQESNLLLTAPRLLLQQYKNYFPIKTWPSPINRGEIDIRMVWHSQTHADAMKVWFRDKLKLVCSELVSKT